MDFMHADGDQQPTVVGQLELKGTGPFEIEAAKNFGEIGMFAYIDVGGDGLSPTDPGGGLNKTVKIGSAPVSGITLTIVDR